MADANWPQKFLSDVWPQERDFFERPDRYRYVRRLVPDEGCVFCRAAESVSAAGAGAGTAAPNPSAPDSETPSPDRMVLAADELVMVLMNKYPYNTGHLLVIPRLHLGDLLELPDDVHARVAWWIKRAMTQIKAALNCQGFNVGLNHGKVAGAGIPDHLHWHVIPRWGGDTNFFPLIAETKVLPETLLGTYTRLKPLFEAIKHA